MKSQQLWDNAWRSNIEIIKKVSIKTIVLPPCFAKTNLMAKCYGHLKKGDGREKFDSHSFEPSSLGLNDV